MQRLKRALVAVPAAAVVIVAGTATVASAMADALAVAGYRRESLGHITRQQ